MFFDDGMFTGDSETELLSNLCTVLVVMHPGEDRVPLDRIIATMSNSLREGIARGDGDVVVLCMRALGILLEKCLRAVRKCAGMLPFLKQLLQAALSGEAVGSRATELGDVSPPPATSSSRRRRSASRPNDDVSGAATVPTLVFSSCLPHELGEEALRCLPLIHNCSSFASVAPSIDLQVRLCLNLSRSCVPTPVQELSLNYLSTLVRSMPEANASLAMQEVSMRVLEVVNGLASACDFSPQWDSLLSTATQLAIVLVARLDHSSGHRSFIDAFHQLCVQSYSRNPAPQRLSLIVGCASSVVASREGFGAADVVEQWESWMKHVMDLGSSNAATGCTAKIGNPFQSMIDDEHPSAEESDEDEDDESDGLGAEIPNRSWVAEHARVSILYMIAHGLFGMRKEDMHWKYVAAWRDDEDTYRRYPPRVSHNLVTSYIAPASSTASGVASIPLPHISPHHSALVGPLLQLNTRTSMLRSIFAQPIPTLGSNPQRSFPFGGFAAVADVPPSSFAALKKINLGEWLRILQPYCVNTAKPTETAASLGGPLSKASRACSTLANDIIFFLVTAREYDPTIADEVVWCFQNFMTCEAVPLSVKVHTAKRLLDQDPKWSDVLARCGAVHMFQAAAFPSVTDLHGGETISPPTKKSRKESTATTTVKDAKALLARLGMELAIPKPVVGSIDSAEDASRFSEETLSLLLLQEEAHHNTASSQTLKQILAHVANGTIPMHTFRRALLRSLERGLAETSLSSTMTSPKRLTKELCDRVLPVHVCVTPESSVLQCPAKHNLRIHHSCAWKCNVCHKHLPTGSWACRTCDYDLCQQCASGLQPNRLDVNHCLTLSDVLRWIRGQATDAPLLASSPLLQDAEMNVFRRLLRETTSLRRLLNFGVREFPSRDLFKALEHPSLSRDPSGAQQLPPSLTILQALRRCTASRQSMRGELTVHVHSTSTTTSLPTPCSCAAIPTPAASPMLTPLHATSRDVSHARSPHATVRSGQHTSPLTLPKTPLLAGLESLVKACSAVDVWSGATEELSSFTMNQLVVTLVRNHAVDVFFYGLDGLPVELSLILEGSCRALVDLAVRVEVMRFCGVECRRAGLIHMFAQNINIQRGHVALPLHEAPVPTKVCVARSDAFDAMMETIDTAFLQCPTIRSKLEFSFIHEEGTGDGPTQELYTEVCIGCGADGEMWWVRDDDDSRILFPGSQCNRRTLVNFRALGACFARSFADGFTMSISLEPVCWTLIVALARRLSEAMGDSSGAPLSMQWSNALLQITEAVDPIFCKSVTSLRTKTPQELAALDLVFPDGTTVVNTSNVEPYIHEVVSLKMGGSVSNASSFLTGFGSVLDPQVLFLVDAFEADKVFCGGKQDLGALLTVDLLQTHVVGAHGYTSDSAEVQRLIQVVAHLSHQHQAQFVEFLTGSPRLPIGGLAGLNRSITVARKEFDCGEQTLPSCNTCFLYLKVPPYKTEAQLRERLILAITEGRRNFSLS